MLFHVNRLLADDSHEISYLIFFHKLGKMSQNLSSAAVVIGALRVKRTVSMFNLKGSIHKSADLRKGSFGHFSSFCVIKILKKAKFSRFCTFLQ